MATDAVPATPFRRAVRAVRPGTTATGPGPRELVQFHSAYCQIHIIGLHVTALHRCLRPTPPPEGDSLENATCHRTDGTRPRDSASRRPDRRACRRRKPGGGGGRGRVLARGRPRNVVCEGPGVRPPLPRALRRSLRRR